jgi:voltage-gated potassium channel
MKAKFETTTKQQGNYIYMLVGLLALITIGPALSDQVDIGSRLFIQGAFSTIMFIGVWTLYTNLLLFKIGIGLAVTSFILAIVNYFAASIFVFLTGLTASFMFLLLSIYLGFNHILFSGRITANKIVGSLCIYLLIGVLWGLIYIFIAIIFVEAFHGDIPFNEYSRMWDYLYFSFVTLTTLGYGDITPTLPFVRSLAYLEAICGQFYLAILVASLVGAYITDHHQNQEGE